jgi:hypothetical protein
MSRSPANFRQSDLIKIIRAGRACGLEPVRTEMRDRALFVHFNGNEPPVPVNELDAWRERRNARSA